MLDRVVVVPANGFVPELYEPMLEAAGFAGRLDYLPPALRREKLELGSWVELIDDLVDWLDRQDSQVILVGHSVGGFTALGAAARRPARVAAVIAFDPVLLAPPRSLIWGLAKMLGLGGRMGMVRRAAIRQDRWASVAEAEDYLAGKPLFEPFAEACRNRIEHLVESDGEGVTLRWSRHWEARIYRTVPARPWRHIGAIDCPAVIVRGSESTTLTGAALDEARRRVRTLELDGLGHLLPFENPKRCAALLETEMESGQWR